MTKTGVTPDIPTIVSQRIEADQTFEITGLYSGIGPNPALPPVGVASYTAIMDPDTCNLTVNSSGSGTGTITSEPAGINCGTTCAVDFDFGSTVTLTAAPDADSVFTGWSGDASGTGDAVLADIDSDKAVTATFDIKTFTVTIDIAGNGTGTLSHETLTVNYGDSLTVTATPDVSSDFTGWSGDASGAGDAVLTNITSDMAITATFDLKTFTVAVDTAGTGTGTLSHTGSQTVNYGENLTVTASPDVSSVFDGWSGDASGTGDAVLENITSDMTVMATFTMKTFTVTIDAAGSGEGTVSHSSPQAVNYGESLTVTASPGASSNFAGWFGDAAGTGDAVLTNITSDKTITAVFNLNDSITVTILAAGNGSGTLSHETHTVASGSNLTVTATPDAGSVFYGWSGDATGFGDAVLENITSDMTITATFDTKTPGDVNLDRLVDLADAVLALQVLAGITDITVFTDNDVNNDQRIGLEEAIHILRFSAGL